MKIEPQFDPHRRTITAFAIRTETICIGVSRSTKRMIWNGIQTIEYSAEPRAMAEVGRVAPCRSWRMDKERRGFFGRQL